jgi:hypothetical protein
METQKEYMKQWRIKNIEKKRAYNKLWARLHKEQISKYRVEYNNRNDIKQQKRVIEKEKYNNDSEYREYRKVIRQRYNKKNKDKLLEYRKKNIDKSQTWRLSYEYKKWQSDVLEHDSYVCQICNKTSNTRCRLHAHHIIHANDNAELRYDIDNGICLCDKHHHQMHARNINLVP